MEFPSHLCRFALDLYLLGGRFASFCFIFSNLRDEMKLASTSWSAIRSVSISPFLEDALNKEKWGFLKVFDTRAMFPSFIFAISKLAYFLLWYSSHKVFLVFLSKMLQKILKCFFLCALQTGFKHSGASGMFLYLFNQHTSLCNCRVLL